MVEPALRSIQMPEQPQPRSLAERIEAELPRALKPEPTVSSMAERFAVDGMVFHSNRSCKPYSLGQYELLEQVSQHTGVPGLILEADMCDTRLYADEPVKNRIQAFLDLLEASPPSASPGGEGRDLRETS